MLIYCLWISNTCVAVLELYITYIFPDPAWLKSLRLSRTLRYYSRGATDDRPFSPEQQQSNKTRSLSLKTWCQRSHVWSKRSIVLNLHLYRGCESTRGNINALLVGHQHPDLQTEGVLVSLDIKQREYTKSFKAPQRVHQVIVVFLLCIIKESHSISADCLHDSDWASHCVYTQYFYSFPKNVNRAELN